MQTTDSIETCAYELKKDLLYKKEEIKFNNIIKQYQNDFDYITKEDIKGHNPNWPQILEHPYRILIVGGSGSGETNALLDHEPDIDKFSLYAKDPYEAKYQLRINKRETTGIKYLVDSKAFIEYSYDMDDFYKNIQEYNPNKKSKILIAFDDIIADMLSNKKLNPIVTELFSRGRKLNVLLFLSHNLISLFQKTLD